MKRIKLALWSIAALNLISCFVIFLLLWKDLDAVSVFIFNLIITLTQILSVAFIFIVQNWYFDSKRIEVQK